jgi:hypothetical protein
MRAVTSTKQLACRRQQIEKDASISLDRRRGDYEKTWAKVKRLDGV